MITSKKRQEFRIKLQKRARQRLEKRMEIFREDYDLLQVYGVQPGGFAVTWGGVIALRRLISPMHARNCGRVVHGSILCDPTQPDPLQVNNLDPTQHNYM